MNKEFDLDKVEYSHTFLPCYPTLHSLNEKEEITEIIDVQNFIRFYPKNKAHYYLLNKL